MHQSGRGVLFKKRLVTEGICLDLLELKRKGVLGGTGGWWTVTWTRGETVDISVSFQPVFEGTRLVALVLSHTTEKNSGGESTLIPYPVQLTSTPCHFGGVRWWFVCPLMVDGQVCGRRCRILYLPPGEVYFGCRECHRLTYECRQRHRDRCYEGFDKHFDALMEIERKVDRPQSRRQIEKLLRKAVKAKAAIEAFNVATKIDTK